MLVISEECNLVENSFAQIITDYFELVHTALKLLMKGVMQVLFTFFILFNQVHEVAKAFFE